MSTVLNDLKPEDLGFDPKRFKKYRQIQLEAVGLVSENLRRFSALSLPTGAGKSLVASAIHKLTGWRTVVLTSTKGLQSQYLKDFKDCGLVDIRGKANYSCESLRNMNCADGQRAGCPSGRSRCTYELAKQKVKEFTVTNYPYWLHVNDRGQRLWGDEEPIECLILDEAHEGPDVLADYMSCRLYEKELIDLIGWDNAADLGDDLAMWVQAATSWGREADMQAENMKRLLKAKGRGASKAELEHASRLESLVKKLGTIQKIQPQEGGWTLEMKDSPRWGRSWEFDVVWPGQYAESKLFLGIEHIVLMSATLRPKTMSLLGIKKEDYEFKEWPRIFQPSRCPVYYLPARSVAGQPIRIRYQSDDADLKTWAEWIDNIIESRLDRKGLVHTVSYSRQKYLMDHSRFSKRMIGNTDDPESPNANAVFQKFADSAVPLILVSPSFSTGWDFSGELAEWQIICKVPFPPGKSKVMQARQKKDPQYLNYLTMQELVQSCGRIMRYEEDRGESFIVDGQLGWFLQQNKGLAPSWFSSGVRTVREIPKVPEKLARLVRK